ncbi:hypothetical protein [Bordetella sp. LUAb4]|nr:hypothetical protein [Bordetella sp. LUAb4]
MDTKHANQVEIAPPHRQCVVGGFQARYEGMGLGLITEGKRGVEMGS